MSMNFKLMWACYNLWRQIKQAPRENLMKLGWKTITGAILVGLGYAAKALVNLEPALDQIGDGLVALGAMIGGIGVAHKFKKMGQA
jgi:hypothetical protein